MPTRYKPYAIRSSNDDGDDLKKIADELEERRDKVLCVLEAECPDLMKRTIGVDLLKTQNPNSKRNPIDIEIELLCAELCKFALKCIALPLRTANKLMPTMSIAVKDPARFLDQMDRLDPEAVARVIGTCAARSKANELALLNREIGIGAGPPPEEIRAAAEEVLARLRQDIANGGTRRRPKVELQDELAIALGRRYVAIGGRLTRVTLDGETGPFHRLLGIVLVPTVRRLAKEAGFSLTIRSMVRIAREELRVSKTSAT